LSELVVESRPDPDRGRVPVRFGTPGARFEEVEELLDCWPGEDHRYFRVRVRGGSEFVLRHDLTTDGWRVDAFRRDAEVDPGAS
jgi:hypothetical protein